MFSIGINCWFKLEIESHPERVLNINRFIIKFKGKGINYPLKTNDWKTYDKNNPTSALYILYIKENEISPGHISKNNNLNRKKQMILFHSYSNEEKEGSFGSKNVSALLHAMQCKELLLFGLSSLFYSRK